MTPVRLGTALAIAAFAAGVRAQTKTVTGVPATSETASPLQLGLRAAFEQRAAAGLPVPASATYTYEVVEGAPASGESAGLRALTTAEASRSVTVVSRTVLAFDGPEQAGYDQGWPRLVLRAPALPGAPGPIEGDYTDAYRAYAEQRLPHIWEAVEFGREPITYTIVETTRVTFPEGSTAASALARALTFERLDAATVDQILLGFTFAGPDIDKTVSEVKAIGPICLPWWLGGGCTDEIEVLDFEAGFRLSWGFGLRLPLDATVSGPLEIETGTSGTIWSSLAGADWTEGQYGGAGVAAYAGNEFVMKLDFFAGVKAELFTVDVCTVTFGFPCYAEIDVDESRTFTTPFGSSAFFPIDPIDLPLYTIGTDDLNFQLGLRMQPLVGSDRIAATASVRPGGSATLAGPAALTFQEPDAAPLGVAVNACIDKAGSRDATVELRDYRYWFSLFLIDLRAYGSVNVIGLSYDLSKSIYTFDLSQLLDGTLSLGRHKQCSGFDFVCSDAGPDDVVAVTATVVDRTAPATAFAATGTAGKEGWYRSDVAFTLAAADLPAGCDSGVQLTEYTLGGASSQYWAPVTLSAEGIFDLQYRSIDVDGTAEAWHPASVKIDKTSPVVTAAATTSPNAWGWYGSPVTVHFTATDALSGVDAGTVTPDVTLHEGAGQSASGSASDLAGNAGSGAVSGLNVDLTPPALAVASPVAGTYGNSTSILVAWSVDASISGLAQEAASVDGIPVANGQSVELLMFFPGSHVVLVEVEDRAGHVASAAVQLDVVVDLPGLVAAQQRACALDWINKYGICVSLEAKLAAALDSVARADLTSANGQIGAFVNELDAQWDKSVNSQAYELLRADALYVLGHLG